MDVEKESLLQVKGQESALQRTRMGGKLKGSWLLTLSTCF